MKFIKLNKIIFKFKPKTKNYKFNTKILKNYKKYKSTIYNKVINKYNIIII